MTDVKRSDLTTGLVLATVARYGTQSWEHLTATWPPKLVLAALKREVDAGRLEYGVALHRPFLTIEGRRALVAAADWPETPEVPA